MSNMYKSYNQVTGSSPYFKFIKQGLIEFECELQEEYKGSLYVLYESKHFMPFEKNQWCYILYLTEVEREVLCEIFKLVGEFTTESIKKTLSNYPYLSELFCGDKSSDASVSVFGSYEDDRYYLHTLVRSNEYSIQEKKKCISRMLRMLEGIRKECSNFSYSPEYLELSEWSKLKMEWELEKQKNPQASTNKYKKRSKLEKYLLIAGILSLKFIVKSVGGDLNIDVPDIDVPDVDVPDVEAINTPEAYANLDNQYNVNFEANETIGNTVYLDKGYTITLEPAGGGLGEENPKVYVESGTNTRYILDGNIPRKIDGVSQITYKGKKWVIA